MARGKVKTAGKAEPEKPADETSPAAPGVEHGAVSEAAPAESLVLTTYKGFDKDFRCLDHQFEVGKTYEVSGKIEACQNGFHACEYPLHIFKYYRPAQSRFAIVKQSGDISRHDGDSKVASAKITIEAEITPPQLIERAVKYIFDRAKWKDGPVATGKNEGVTASGHYGAATASGHYGAATASGSSGAATALGYYGAATASGYQGRASGKEGCAIFLVERDDNYNILWEFCGHAGAFGVSINSRGEISGPHPVKPDTFYTLKNGKPVEWTES